MASTVRGPGKPGLVALCALASASGLWGLFLWTELISSRSGGQVFCPLGEAASCTALWDSGFATAIHTATGLPIAGWGLIWGLVALAVAVALLGADRSVLLLGMLVATAAAGTVAVLVLMVVSIAAGTICGNCLLTYLLVCGFVGVVFSTTRGLAPADLARGGAATAALTAVFLVVLLYPGSRTPLGAVESRVPDPRAELRCGWQPRRTSRTVCRRSRSPGQAGVRRRARSVLTDPGTGSTSSQRTPWLARGPGSAHRLHGHALRTLRCLP